MSNLKFACMRCEAAQLRDEEQMVVRRDRVVAHILLQAEAHTLTCQLPFRDAPHVLRAHWEQTLDLFLRAGGEDGIICICTRFAAN